MPGPELRPLIDPDKPDKVVARYCVECRMVAKWDAEHCLYCYYECGKCAKQMPKGVHGWCKDCSATESVEREERRFAKATKISYADYEGTWIYDDEEYYDSLGALFEAYWDEGKRPPPYVWGCDEERLHIDAEHIVEHALQEHYEDAGENIRPSDMKRLQAYLDVWCRKQEIVSYHDNGKLAILISDEEIAEYEKQYGPFGEADEEEFADPGDDAVVVNG